MTQKRTSDAQVNKKRKIPPAKVNKGVKKRQRLSDKDPVSDPDELHVDSEDEFVKVYYFVFLGICIFWYCTDVA